MTLIPFDLVTKTVHRLDIEKPILQLDLQALMKSSATSSNPLVLRHLNVRGGTIVIKKGDDIVIELPNLNLAAANLDLREKSGIGLRADIPALDAEAELQLKGQMRQLESNLIIRAKEKRGRFSSQAANLANEKSVRLHAKLNAPENQQASLTWESKFHDFAVGDSRITGAVKGQMEVDAKFTEANFEGRADIEGFPNTLMGALPPIAEYHRRRKLHWNVFDSTQHSHVKIASTDVAHRPRNRHGGSCLPRPADCLKRPDWSCGTFLWMRSRRCSPRRRTNGSTTDMANWM